ncbi:hypothetical protein C0216_17985 [Streptomyces globosus]|uniref:ATP-grasp domain-containing protein n=1 Tax=Streptomyces globosus TaxID=68209 RepID=A0A344U2G8_9ACTN|nr:MULTISPECIES: hypothetical protein [Streptomyces]AXE25089.1 hypothetical protein C0216_17985 [Streptomyces globosus]
MTGTTRVAVATSALGLAHDSDLPVLLEALRARGLEAEAADWNEPDRDWSRYSAVTIRSTWDYALRRPSFLAWAEAVEAATLLDNPADVVRWNTDKRYLHDLADRGVPVVPTRFAAPGEDVPLPEEGHFVVKPSVSAGAQDTARYAPHQRGLAAAHAAALHASGRTVMVQPYLSRIEEGERALVFLGGVFSHAIRKGPVLTETGLDNTRTPHPGLAPHQPTAPERELARAALAAVPADRPLLYARVDIATADDGRPVVMELELVEPDLFLGHSADGAARLAGLIRDRAASAARPRA